MASIAEGNKKVFPEPAPNATPGRVDGIVDRTRAQMFGDTSIDNPATTYGGGSWNSIAAMEDTDGKENQEAYRIGLSRSRAAHDKVTDR